MAHDPCIQCGSYEGNILVDGDAPRVTLCSYSCLEEWAKEQQD